MRFVTRTLAGLGAAVVLAAGAAATAAPANAATAAGAKSATTAWGAYFSADGKAKAAGAYQVSFDKVKVGHWKTWYTWDKKCWHHDGKKFCKPVKKPHKKWVWKWVTVKNYTVHSTLWNFKWQPATWKQRCAWETFKVRHTNGKVTYHSFNNCHKGSKHFTFHAENVDRIWVDVARGNPHRPLTHHSGWRPVV